ncbi:hypothetical protein BDY19DRAFT_893767 [Irpex rosettiformis]|uniref:Uncharacterized protein n=1 Tax=Irpex rosettiformis TaxID=378272 RepID=A0ACB8TXZ7_9APHY|nr:hypothetical protein BDY19DRAFT_893767 [Irpex rosettiformis]
MEADTLPTNPSPSSLLISARSSRDSPRPPTLQPSTTHLNLPTATLFPDQYIQPTRHPQNVLPSVNSSFTRDIPDTAGQHGSSRLPLLEHYPPSCASINSHVSINSSSWTPAHPVITNPTALAAHHGIPQSLPPVPRTTRYLSTENQAISSSSSNNDFDFSTLRNNYLTMLSQKPVTAAPPASVDESVQAVFDLLIASPEYQSLGNEFPSSEYLTSPMDDSPWEDMLTTPALGTSDFMTSPAIVDSDDFGFGEASLFEDSFSFNSPLEPVKSTPSAPAVQHPASFDGLYTMPSPDTPALDPSSLNGSANATPVSPAIHSFKTPARRKNPPTGTRKNITPDALIPYDAPIQARKYLTPSVTSRKEVPAVFAKKRSRSQALGDDDDDLQLDSQDMDAIEAKRRQNTLAARRSRKRKLEYQRELEAMVEKANEERDHWMDRARALENALRERGLDVPTLPPPP